MKQFVFLILLTLIGTIGAFAISPFWGVAVYYLFAVLRPQYIWDWALLDYDPHNQIRWSFYVAIATILAAVAHKLGFISIPEQDKSLSRDTTVERGSDAPPARAFTPAHILMLLFGVWIGVSYLGAKDQEVAAAWFWEYAKIFVMFLTAALLIRSTRQVWILFVIAASALGYLAYEVNSTYLEWRRITIYDVGYGGLDNNGAGLMLAMGVPLCLFVWEGTERWWRWIFAACIPLLIHAVLLSYSRGAMLALLAASPLFFLRSRHKRHLLVGGLILFLALLPRMAGKEIRERFFSMEQYDKDESVQGRFHSWDVAWRIAHDYPIEGIGLRNASVYARDYDPEAKGRTIHSQYLQILADTGFVGLGLYLAALFMVWRSTRRVQRTAQDGVGLDQRHIYATASGVECAMAVFCVGAVFLSLEVFELPYLLLLLGSQLPLFVPCRADKAVEQPAVPVEQPQMI
jgi:probable O-glycosylation ligase (exosortase A-associated)